MISTKFNGQSIFFSDLGKLIIYLNFMQENRKPFFWADWLCAKGT